MDDAYYIGALYDHEITTKHNISQLEAPFFQKEIALRVVVGVTCFFSLIGALIIIFSYFFNKDIRTKSRQILVHLSVADFGVALANLIGVTVYFDQYIRDCKADLKVLNPSKLLPVNGTVLSSGPVQASVSCRVLYSLCEAQAFVAGYSTLASVLWTQILAVYIYCLILLLSRNHKCFKLVYMYFASVFSWGMPCLICFWLLFTGHLGYSPHGGEGWCSLKIYDESHKPNVLVVILANDLWIYLTFFTVTILYLSIHCIKAQARNTSYPALLHGSRALSGANKVDTKFFFIPLCFLLLRMWTQILILLHVYARLKLPTWFIRVLIYAAGIGDSGQGFVNAVLFCILTPNDRQRLWSCLVNVLCCKRCRRRYSQRSRYLEASL